MSRLSDLLRKSLSLHIFVLVSFFCLPSPEAAEKSKIKNIRYWSTSGHTRVVVDLSRPVEFSNKRLSNPDRLYFDLKDSEIAKEITTKLPVDDGILKAVRAGQFNAETVRVVLDLAAMEDFKVFILDDPTRLIIDVHAKKVETAVSKKIVVLDPGHGGHDPGAVGPTGLFEKDVALDIALKVKEMLSKETTLDISLTRDKDVFIPLEERTAIAMGRNADLFVSIHANASPKRAARGIETYLLNWTNDEEAIRVSARENAISVKRMKEKMQRYKNELDIILSDLSRDFKRDESLKLANYVQSSMVSTMNSGYMRVVDLGVKQAFFYVLVGASMPSILAEVAFISNPEEERLLAKESHRAMIAGSIASGIKSYLSSSAPQQKTAESKRAVSMKDKRLVRTSAAQ